MKQTPPPEWEVKDMLDGRLGIFRYGLYVGSVRSQEAVKGWIKDRYPDTISREKQDQAVHRAVR
jgi:hypothetical protein